MAACPLCILGLTEEEHTPDRWAEITREEMERVAAHWFSNTGSISEPTHEET